MECSLPVTFIRNVKADMQNPFVRMRCDVCLFCSARCRGGSEGIEVTWRRSRVSRGGGFAPSCIRTSENSPSETVRKGLLREWLGRVPNMRKAYQTDLSDAEWSYIEPHLPTPKAPGAPGYTPCARSSRPTSTSCVVDVPGACCRTTFLPGRPSTITSEPDGLRAPGRGYTLLCAVMCECARNGILSQALA